MTVSQPSHFINSNQLNERVAFDNRKEFEL